MAKYGKKSEEMVKEAVGKFKHGKLESGTSKKKVTSKKQAIAIGLSEARKKDAKLTPAPSRRKKTVKKSTKQISRPLKKSSQSKK